MHVSNNDFSFYRGDMGNGVSVNLDENKYVNIYINIASGTVVDNLIFKPQLELNSIATPYEPYQGQTYTSTPSGNVPDVVSLSTMTLMTNSLGIAIEVEYNRDLNKVIEKLEQSLL